jgi:hypothetical protein
MKPQVLAMHIQGGIIALDRGIQESQPEECGNVFIIKGIVFKSSISE